MTRKKGLFDSIFKKIGLRVYDYGDFMECMAALEDKDPEMRIKALEALVQKHCVEDIMPIVKVMQGDGNFQVQEAAMNALGEIGRPEAVEPLISMLRAPDQWLRVKAAMTLGQIGDQRALKPMIEASQGVKEEYRTTIERLIARLGSSSQSPELIEERAGEPATPPAPGEVEPSIRQDLKLSGDFLLSRKRESREAQSLREQEREDLRSKGEDKLEEKLRFQLSRASSSRADEKIVEYYYDALVHGDIRAERALCGYLRGPSENVRLQALQALTGIGRKPFIVQAMLDILEECSSQMCWRIIVALCEVEDKVVGKKILPFLDDVDKKTRRYAQNYFLIYPSPEMVEVLLKDYESLSEGSKIERASLIARMDIESSKPALYKLLQDPRQPEKVVLNVLDKLPPRQEEVILWSLPILLRRKEESLIDSLFRRLKDNWNNLLLIEYLRQNALSSKEIMRGRAILLLGHLGDNSFSSTIAKLLADTSEYVRLRAARALLALNSKDHYELLCNAVKRDSVLRNRLEYIQIIDQLYGEKALDLFMDLLQDKSSEVRILLLDSLAKKNWNVEEKGRLIEKAQHGFEDKDVRINFYTIVLLVKLGSRKFLLEKQRLLSLLWNIIKDERNPAKIRREGLYCMLYLSRDDTKEVLKSLVKKDRDDEMRMQAAYYLSSYDGEDVIDALTQACRASKKEVAQAARESLKKIQLRRS